MSNQLTTKDMLNANRDVRQFGNSYAKGLADEKRVIAFLQEKGFDVKASSAEDNRQRDIDCYIGNIPVSIKAEHKGLAYGDIYFELKHQLTTTGEWVDEGWFVQGQATKYLILQGTELRLYDKETVKQYVEENGWSHTRTLSWSVKASQGGTYRYSDTLSGYLKKHLVPYEASWEM